MTAEVEDRIARLLITLSVHCGHLDLQQIERLARDACQKSEEDERRRCLQILEVMERRVAASKGRSWRTEMEIAKREMENGQQVLF